MVREWSRVLWMIDWMELRIQGIEGLRLGSDLCMRPCHTGLDEECILHGWSATSPVADTFAQIVSIILV
jgi:hypothetical protein